MHELTHRSVHGHVRPATAAPRCLFCRYRKPAGNRNGIAPHPDRAADGASIEAAGTPGKPERPSLKAT